jgi:cyclopropane fatty-acyl-phospholipid synthase-like methyltransferase
MRYSKAELKAALTLEQFPRAAHYDPEWMLENRMGPNAIWLAEALSQVMDFRPGMHVLDMGCGKAISSIFLAREFKINVWAADLWIDASQNWKRIQEAGLMNQVFPIHTEAHSLPFANGFFDAIVSLDAYHYFGTDDLYLGNIIQYLCPGGQIGIVVPGLVEEFADEVPAELAPYWEWDFCSFHSPAWWRRHWGKTGLVTVESADTVPDGWKHWLTWQEICFAQGVITDQKEEEMLQIDGGRNLGFTRMVARKKAVE